MKIAVILAPCEEGGYLAYVPSLPGCISGGGTTEEALANVREAFELFVEPTEGDLIPEEDDATIVELELSWAPTPKAGPAEARARARTANLVDKSAVEVPER